MQIEPAFSAILRDVHPGWLPANVAPLGRQVRAILKERGYYIDTLLLWWLSGTYRSKRREGQLATILLWWLSGTYRSKRREGLLATLLLWWLSGTHCCCGGCQIRTVLDVERNSI